MAKRTHKEQIKADLRIKFGTLRAFEQCWGLKPDSTRDALRGRKSRRVENAVAAALGKPADKLFPHRKADQSCVAESTNRDDSPQIRDAHRLSAEAV